MDMFIVQGGTPLHGTVRVSGSKNAALPIMAAALAADGVTQLENVPDLVDVRTLSQLLRSLGADVSSQQHQQHGVLSISVHDETACTAEYDLVRRMRAGVCVLGPLLAKRGRACVSLPGGCNIGHRPIDLHLKGLAALGADIEVRSGYVHARAKRLRGATIFLGGPQGSTVTGTCNVMTAAALACGTTILEAAACEPEVTTLADFLNAMGARITGQGTPRLVIEGVPTLQACRFTIIPDRIEAATLMLAAAITRGSVQLENVLPEHLTAVITTLRETGCEILHTQAAASRLPSSSVAAPDDGSHCTSVLTLTATSPLRPRDLTALPYPGVPTDVQAQLMALLCTIPGTSVVRDLVFPERFMHVAELCRLGADIRQDGSAAIVSGRSRLTGAHVMACDLRASAALVLAGLAAEGETVIRRIYHLDRGYETLERKLFRLGAAVQRVTEAEFDRGLAREAQRPPVESLQIPRKSA